MRRGDSKPLSKKNTDVVAFQIEDPDDPESDVDVKQIRDRLASYKKHGTRVNFSIVEYAKADSPDLLAKLDSFRGLQRLEIVAHGTPLDTGDIGFDNCDVIGGWLKKHSAKSAKVFLSGCNTGNCDFGVNISQKLSWACKRPVYGTKGYQLLGTYAETIRADRNPVFKKGMARCRRHSLDTDRQHVFCGSTDAVGKDCYRVAVTDREIGQVTSPYTAARIYRPEDIDSEDLPGPVIAQEIAKAFTKAPQKLVTPLVGADLILKFELGGTERVFEIIFGGRLARERNGSCGWRLPDSFTLRLREHILAPEWPE